MVEVIYGKTTKDKPFIVCCQFVYYKKAPNKDSVRYKCKECDASLTIDNETNRIIKVSGKKFRDEANIEDLIISSHEDCERMNEREVLAFDSLKRYISKIIFNY